jgi:hypothetical protein
MGNTPIGRSLFYAGEYVRKYVVVSGRPCEQDADCRNVNYSCSPTGTCVDPLQECRETAIVLFTDGVEEPATVDTDFFNPNVQAKRMHFGLDCSSDDDCLNGATCQDGTCQGYDTPNTGEPVTPVLCDDSEGANVLRDYGGNPIPVTVHVVDFSDGDGYEANRLLADHGGGTHFDVHDDDPEDFLQSMILAFDAKSPVQCVGDLPPEAR